MTAFGLGRLGLAPDAFWRATPKEIAAAARAFRPPAGPPAMGRADLAALMARFPDQET
ncbi:phage tail assembly chaperone [Methylopila jiangsuensis]|uniref:phage tail assembly chaperone n=1 Tax=Methylopila jiangsuensis TaxID=586230 RepID=UPI0022F2A884|nr:phage tail assembly chaperone [Methylopila jiangsuensis]